MFSYLNKFLRYIITWKYARSKTVCTVNCEKEDKNAQIVCLCIWIKLFEKKNKWEVKQNYIIREIKLEGHFKLINQRIFPFSSDSFASSKHL